MTVINLRLEPNEDGRLIYYPGQLLRGFHVTVFGQAEAHWTETRTRTVGSGDRRRTENYTVHFEGKEVYLNSRTYLFGQRGGPTFGIQPGIHKYDFACQLPEQLPYTVELRHGSVRYYAEAVLDIPWRFDKETKAPFTVVRYDDLNMSPELRIAQKYEEIKTFCCLFCASGPLVMTVSIPYTGFAAGQIVPIKIDYVNKSDVDILRTKIKLNRRISYTSHTPEHKTRTDTERMVEIIVEGVKEGGSKYIEANFEIPRIMMCSNERFCQVVTISYVMEVEGEVGGCHSNPEIIFPIVIGSVPIRLDNQFIAPQIPMVQPVMPQGPIVQPVMPQVPFGQPVMPQIQPSAPVADQNTNDLPPSFEEAMNYNKPESIPFMQPSPSGNLGWNISTPSAPVNEKQ